MRIGVLGTGDVGRALATALVRLGHDVTLGSRTPDNAAATAWAEESGGAHGTFADAAAAGELVVNATGGLVALAALEAAGGDNLRGKVLVDVSNPLDFSGGFPPKVGFADGVSLAERIARAYPETRVVKTLNTVNFRVMVEPSRVPGDHVIFVCADDEAAKGDAVELLRAFGWPAERIVDLGGLVAARGTEQYLGLWLALAAATGTNAVNIGLHLATDGPGITI